MPDVIFTILLVDDDAAIRRSMHRLLNVFEDEKLEVLEAGDGKEALEHLTRSSIQLAFVDLHMPSMNGLSLLGEIKKKTPEVHVIILTGSGSIRDAISAIQQGADDFLEKPFHGDELYARLRLYCRTWRAEQENQALREEVAFTFGYEKLIGFSTPIMTLKRMVTQVGPSDKTVLIQGETGTGKELVARALHHHSMRSHAIFVPVDCASLSESIMESELFGHTKGSYTGADSASPGLIRAADGGTVFFDEIGELPLSMQSKLLRTIQEREVRPVGGTRSIPVDIRILAATNRNLEQEVAENRFREDLYYRLDVIQLRVAPLRERRDDIPLLAEHFLKHSGKADTTPALTTAALEALEAYDWPGNVRELANILHRSAVLCGGRTIDLADLPPAFADSRHTTVTPPPGGGSNAAALVRSGTPGPLPGSALLPGGVDEAGIRVPASMQEHEKQAIVMALDAAHGHRRTAATILGIGEATLYRKLKRYGLGSR